MVYRKNNSVEIYAITGNKGHGKDTFAKLILDKNPNFKVVHFAGPLKNMAMQIFSLTGYQVHDSIGKEEKFISSVNIDDFIHTLSKETGLNIQPRGLIANSARELLQFIGTDYVRSCQDDFWIQRFLQSVHNKNKVLIPDCRFPNEADIVRHIGGRVIKVTRIDIPDSSDSHASETLLRSIVPDLEIGARTGDLSYPRRIANLIGMNRFDNAIFYGYPVIQNIIKDYTSGTSGLEQCSMEHLHTKDTVRVKNILNYYGIPIKKQRKPKNTHIGKNRVFGKNCARCHEWKPLIDFNTSTKNWDALHTICRGCAAVYNQERYKKYRSNTLKSVWNNMIKTSRYRNIENSISCDDIETIWENQKGRCFYSGCDMSKDIGSSFKVTIDRKDSSRGYHIDNVVLCCYAVNVMKNKLSINDFYFFIESIHKNKNKEE